MHIVLKIIFYNIILIICMYILLPGSTNILVTHIESYESIEKLI